MFEPLTDEQREGYLQAHYDIGTHCPRCKSEDYYSDSFQPEADQVWQKFKCNECEGQWTEVFTFSFVETPEDFPV